MVQNPPREERKFQVLLTGDTPRGPWDYHVDCVARNRPEAEVIALDYVAQISAPGMPIRVTRVTSSPRGYFFPHWQVGDIISARASRNTRLRS
jgi:hypothetical protein